YDPRAIQGRRAVSRMDKEWDDARRKARREERLILVERLPDGRYRASRGNDWAEWHPTERPDRAVSMATKAFKRELRDLGLGLGCTKCSYLKSEHNIDGEEKAPCDGFVAPEGGEGA